MEIIFFTYFFLHIVVIVQNHVKSGPYKLSGSAITKVQQRSDAAARAVILQHVKYKTGKRQLTAHNDTLIRRGTL